MTTVNPRVSHTRLLRLTGPVYGYAFFEEFILLYPLYALLFTEHGLTVTHISALFVLWSLTSVLSTVPAGALADLIPRRYLLATAPLLTGSAFALWLLLPSPWVFALGFVLWGAAGALSSGAFEALVYTEMDHRGATAGYAGVMGLTRALGVAAVGVAAVGVATVAAVPVMAHGGYLVIGLASVAACLLCAICALTLPEHRAPGERGSDEGPGYRQTLRRGLAEVRHNRKVRPALLLVVLVSAFWGSLEEYVPLLARDSGVSAQSVPLVVLVVWTGVTLGGLSAGPASRLPGRALAALMTLAAVAIAAGALLTGPWGWALLGLGFGACQAMMVVADARLQETITGSSRATVTSLADLGTETPGIATFLVYAGVFAALGHGATFALFAAPHLLIALLLARRGD